MVLQTTKQPTCSKEQERKAVDQPSAFKRFSQVSLKAVKYVLRFVLLRPSTWRFLMVRLPDVVDKVAHWLANAAAFLKDLF